VTQKNGIWVNNAAISASDSFNGTTGYAFSQYQGTLLGSFYTTANGQTGVNIKPSSASGGTNNIVGLCNAYNRTRLISICRDNNSGYTYNVNAWRQMDNNANNRVSWLDCLQQICIDGRVENYASLSSATYGVGILLDATSGTPNLVAQVG